MKTKTKTNPKPEKSSPRRGRPKGTPTLPVAKQTTPITVPPDPPEQETDDDQVGTVRLRPGHPCDPSGGYPRPNLERLAEHLAQLLRVTTNIAAWLTPAPAGAYKTVALHGALARFLRTALPLADTDLVDVLTRHIAGRLRA